MSWSVLQVGGARRDPWWDPAAHARRRRRARRTRLLAIATIALVVTSLGLGVETARAATTVNLDQWASLDLAWQNGNLNGNNSRYPEGGLVPFRLALEGLAAGPHQIHVNYDFTAGGHKAYDFLATWNATNASGAICAPSGGAISSMCPSLGVSSTYPFPSDPYVADGLSVSGAQIYSGAPRKLTLWGGTITSISGPTHSGSAAGNSTADFVVGFTTGGGAALLAWGGHLAQSSYWNAAIGGPPDGAAQVSGAPWHMRTLQLDASGNKNQDRSIQPSAIVGELPPFALASPGPVAGPGPGPVPGPTAAPAQPGAPMPAPTGPALPRLTPPPTSTAGIALAGPSADSTSILGGLLAALLTVALARASRHRWRARQVPSR